VLLEVMSRLIGRLVIEPRTTWRDMTMKQAILIERLAALKF
jgi:hypothetical protein